ncbi:MAG: ATP-binding protein [Deltaproteobacteria bacterium]|nr:ATP-binding protein [Deltaproteobacteria bacterium]
MSYFDHLINFLFRETGKSHAFAFYKIHVPVTRRFTDGYRLVCRLLVDALDEVTNDISFAIDSLETAKKKLEAEETLRESEERLRSVIEQSPVGIAFSRDGITLDANKVYVSMFGYANIEELRGTPLINQIALQCRQEIINKIRRRAQGQEVEITYETIGLRQDATQFPFQVSVNRIVLPDGPLTISFFIDITARKKAEAELRKYSDHLEEMVNERTALLITKTEQLNENQSALMNIVEDLNSTTAELAVAKDRAEGADRLKSAFLATMSHELRTPLNSIIGFTGIVLQGMSGPLNEEQAKQLTMVKGSANHLLALINDVLDISKIEAGQVQITRKSFDMRSVIEAALRTVLPLAAKKGLSLDSVIASDVGVIISDRRRVEQILINLVNNAVKFTEQGEVRIGCRITEDRLETRVCDTGIGIKAEDTGKLFTPFSQIDTGLARNHEGTGLGLSICGKLVEMLGGTIRVESEWGKGSTFIFTLPLT